MTWEHNAFHAAVFAAQVDAQSVRGFGETEVDAMRNAIESKRIEWEWDTPPATWLDWSLITQDAKRAGILTFTPTAHGVLAWDNN